MEFRLDYMFMKPSDFKICKSCGEVNWYENESCKECGSERFDDSEKAVRKWVDCEYEYWKKIEGYSEEEADSVLVEA